MYDHYIYTKPVLIRITSNFIAYSLITIKVFILYNLVINIRERERERSPSFYNKPAIRVTDEHL